MISSISRLEDKSSKVVKSNIQHNCRGVYSYNITVILYTSPFSTIYIKYYDINQTNNKKVSIFIGDNNSQKTITFN